MQNRLFSKILNNIQIPHDHPVITLAVKFGMPGNQCKNFGICKAELLEYNSKTELLILAKFDSIVKMVFFQEEILMCFLKKSMDLNLLEKHFSNNSFTISEKFVFGSQILFFLDLNSLSINAGIYPVLETEDNLIITFKPGIQK